MGFTDEENAHVEDIASANKENLNANDYAPPEIQREAEILQDAAHVAAQKKYLRKLDLIILPAISILYFFEYLDRGNIAVSCPWLRGGFREFVLTPIECKDSRPQYWT